MFNGTPLFYVVKHLDLYFKLTYLCFDYSRRFFVWTRVRLPPAPRDSPLIFTVPELRKIGKGV